MKATMWIFTEYGWNEGNIVDISDLKCSARITDDPKDYVGYVCGGDLKKIHGGYECKYCGTRYELEVEENEND